MRDYGTATWEGGSAKCDHKKRNARNDPDRDTRHTDGRDPETQNLVGCQDVIQYGDVCGKCGARRVDAQLGLERTPEEYVEKLVDVFREVRRVLTNDGTLFLNLGDSYARGAGGVGECPGGGKQGENWKLRGKMTPPNRMSLPGLKPKDLIGIPWRVAFALQADGWWLRSDIVWSKPNPMPESVRDRPTKAHEYIFLLSKSAKYYYDADAIAEESTGRDAGNGFDRPHRLSIGEGDPTPWVATKTHGKHSTTRRAEGAEHDSEFGTTRNARSVWTIATKPYHEAHFATFPPELAERCIKAGSAAGDTVLDPFGGSGTTASVAIGHGREAIHIDLTYHDLAVNRIGPMFCERRELLELLVERG